MTVSELQRSYTLSPAAPDPCSLHCPYAGQVRQSAAAVQETCRAARISNTQFLGREPNDPFLGRLRGGRDLLGEIIVLINMAIEARSRANEY